MTENKFDQRVHAYRSDIADISLEGKVKSKNFVTGTKYQVAIGLAPLFNIPNLKTPLSNQLLYGEFINVFEIKDGWAWGQSLKDGYVGYCQIDNLTPDLHEITHHVSAVSSHIYSEPNIKTHPVDRLPMMAEVSVIDEKQSEGFFPLADGNWIYATDVSKDFGMDPVSEALKFLYAPYLWGGRSIAGIDCSGLIQTAFASVGVIVPRDADLQQAEFGKILDDEEELHHGDIAFFPGHVGIMLDDMHLLHANAHHMRVSVDPLREVLDVISFQTDEPPLTCIKRVSFSL